MERKRASPNFYSPALDVANNPILLANSKFPFNRIHLPVTNNLSPIIISKLFGKENVIYVNKSDLSMHSSA